MKKIYRYIKCFLLVLVLILGFLIYAKNDAEASFINSVFNTHFSFVKMNSYIDLYINSLLSNFNIFNMSNNEDKLVNGSVSYIKSNINNYYYCESNYVYGLTGGIIYKVDKEDDLYDVTVFYENEVTACYYELKNVQVSYQDKIDCSSIIGEYDNHFKVLFEYNDSLISYEEALFI